jgi:hypothetical protein
VASGAGERPAKSSLTSPVFSLSDGPPLWSAFAHLAYTCSRHQKKRSQALPAVSEIACVRCQYLRLQVGSERIGLGTCGSAVGQ